jgi:hypothetical protein
VGIGRPAVIPASTPPVTRFEAPQARYPPSPLTCQRPLNWQILDQSASSRPVRTSGTAHLLHIAVAAITSCARIWANSGQTAELRPVPGRTGRRGHGVAGGTWVCSVAGSADGSPLPTGAHRRTSDRPSRLARTPTDASPHPLSEVRVNQLPASAAWRHLYPWLPVVRFGGRSPTVAAKPHKCDFEGSLLAAVTRA